MRQGFGKKVPDYAAAMNFVSGGVKGGPNRDEKQEDTVIMDAGTSSVSSIFKEKFEKVDIEVIFSSKSLLFDCRNF